MTIKFKLLTGGILISIVLSVVLALTIYSFNSLNAGFEVIIDQSGRGVENSQATQSNIAQADQNLTQISESMLSIADDINKTNMTVRVLERKIKMLSGTVQEFVENLEEAVEAMPEDEARYIVEDAADAAADIEESMRREALVSLSTTVGKMRQFTKKITAQVSSIQQLSGELNKGKQLSSDVVAVNQEIRTGSEKFGTEIVLSRNIISLVLLTIIMVMLIAVFLLARSITRPLGRAVEIAKGIASGDLNQIVDIKGNDEIGQMGASMTLMLKNLGENIEETRCQTEEKARIEEEQHHTMLQAQLQMADEFEDKVGVLIRETMSEVHVVGDNSEAMTAMSEELKSQAQRAMSSAEEGAEHVRSTAAATEEMSVSIEAVRAGDAGRGFAVVASEVKELAQQTAKATEEISIQISGMQKGSEGAVQAISTISKTISTINENSESVAEAMEQQTLAMDEISQSAQMASTSMSDASHAIQDVSTAAERSNESTCELLTAVKGANEKMHDVDSHVDEFLANIRNN